jgi:lipopolysaccharide export system protein LptC
MSVSLNVSWWLRLRRAWDRVSVYLPLVLMGLMAMSTYWLVRNTPFLGGDTFEEAPRHVPDYYMQDFSVRVFGQDGKLKSEMVGAEGRHFPDTDTLEVDDIRVRILNAEGRLTTATAKRGLINSDATEVQLFDRAVVVREAFKNKQDVLSPRTELRSEFLHFFANTERVRSHLPVLLLRGSEGDQFAADSLDYDNLDRVIQLKGHVRGTLLPRKDKAK